MFIFSLYANTRALVLSNRASPLKYLPIHNSLTLWNRIIKTASLNNVHANNNRFNVYLYVEINWSVMHLYSEVVCLQ
jgi:hypothetical protein